MAKGEISWKRTGEFGDKIQVYARHVGDRWIFYARERRFDEWQRLADPPLADWLALLDGIRRRINRRLRRPEEEPRLIKVIRERFPDCGL